MRNRIAVLALSTVACSPAATHVTATPPPIASEAPVASSAAEVPPEALLPVPEPTLPPGRDFHGAELPEGAVARFGSDRFRVASTNATLAFDRAGIALVLDHRHGIDVVREIVSGKERLARKATAGGAISPDGSAMVDGELNVIDLADGRVRVKLELPKTTSFDRKGKRRESTPSVRRLVASDRAQIVIVETHGSLYVFDGKTGALKHTLSAPAPPPLPGATGKHRSALLLTGPTLSTLSLARNGTALLTEEQSLFGMLGLFGGPATTPTVRVWDLATGQGTTRPRSPTPAPRDRWHALSSDGATAIVSRDERTILVDAKTGKETSELETAVSFAEAAAFSGDGASILLARGRSLRLFDRTGKERRRFERRASQIILSDDGTRVVARQDHALMTGDEKDGLDEGPSSHADTIRDAAVSRDGQLLATLAEDGVRFWDARVGKPLGHAPMAGARRIAFSPRGETLWITIGTKLVSVTLNERGRARELPKTPLDITSLAFGAPGGPAAIAWGGSSKDRVAFVDTESGTRTALDVPHSFVDEPWKETVTAIAFSRSGAHLAVVAGALHVFRVADRELVQTVRLLEERRTTELHFLTDDRLLLGGSPAHVVTLGTGDVGVWGAPCSNPGVSPSGTLVACASDRKLTFHDAGDARVVAERALSSEAATAPRFTPDGRRVLTFHRDGTGVAWSVP